jgi:hypothetical protein
VGQMGVLIPILAIFFGGMVILSKTAIGAAIARRIGGEVAGHDVEDRLVDLRQDLDSVRHELAETQERLDFTERTLAQVRQAQRLPPAG